MVTYIILPPNTWILFLISSLIKGLANLYNIGNILGAEIDKKKYFGHVPWVILIKGLANLYNIRNILGAEIDKKMFHNAKFGHVSWVIYECRKFYIN